MDDNLLKRYLQEKELTYVDISRRVAKNIAFDELQEQDFFEALIHKEFIPSSMILYSAGTPNPCYASDIAIPWSQKEVVTRALHHGLGCSLVLPTSVTNMEEVVSFLRSCKDISQRGLRPGAVMLLCSQSHPCIDEFIQLKNNYRDLTHVNFSVIGDIVSNAIVENAHACGDPGMVFSSMNADYVAPCGQMPLKEWESVVYAHINLAVLVDCGVFDVVNFLHIKKIVQTFLSKAMALHTTISKKNFCTKYAIGVVGFAQLVEQLDCDNEQIVQLATLIASLLGEHGALAPTGSTSALLGVSPNIEGLWDMSVAIAFQKQISGAISKTQVLAHSATKDDVRAVFEAAKNSLKGITVYRLNSL